MSKLSQKLKSIVKNPAGKETFGTNPSDPWSAKANIAESASLNAYLKSKGIDPKFISTNAKISHAKSADYIRWKMRHNEEVNLEEDQGHMATKGESGKTSDRSSGLKKSISSYKEIKTPRGPGSHHESKGSQMTALTPESVSMEIHNEAKKKMSALDKFRQASYEREKAHKEFQKSIAHLPQDDRIKASLDRLAKSVNKEEEIGRAHV